MYEGFNNYVLKNLFLLKKEVCRMGLSIDFTGKTVLVTGAGRGLGKAMALTFAQAGADVYLGNRKEDQGMETVKEIEAMGRKSGFTRCDVAKEEDVKKLLHDAVDFGGGKLDVFVNAAGVISIEDVMYTSDEEVKRLFDINVLGTIHALKHGLSVMEKQKHGNIVTVSSIAGRGGMAMLQAYCASKASVISLTQSAAKMAAPYGVRVNSIAPGIIRTSMWEEILDGMAHGWNPDDKRELSPEEREKLWNASVQGMIPMGHAQQPEDIAWATAFIASDLAREITGQVLAIDGGTTMV